MTSQQISREPESANRHVLVGAAMMLIGLALFASRNNIFHGDWWSTWWAAVLFVAGMARFIYPGECEGRPNSRRLGAWLMGVGAWAWVSQNHIAGLDYRTSWPLLVTFAGLMTVWEALAEPPMARRSPRHKEK